MSGAADPFGESARPEVWIVAIAERRDRDGFISLFNHFAPKVKGYLMRHGVSAPSAEELAQETFLSVWRKAATYDPMRASAAAWIYTIARNLHVDQLRRDRHAGDNRMFDHISAPATPEEELKIVEGEERVRRAIDALPPEQAAVLRMSFFEDQTHIEIANQLRLPLGTVKSRIRLAAAHLRSALDDLV